ncbi:hypothetical protein JG687_00016275 [Phytophthora cactorum]|uniref:glucan endo-1,3-beta-D-glucosidase n=1 Tax=Phytophthora cactorum TaxID=29920 RepID=A0A8T1TTS1_9STRA|nr:hypothetical protein JG687_00016275 [Phytophthora cactorum]
MAPIINVAEGLLGKPLPTNKWWGNLIHTTAEEMNTKANPGWSNPYAVKLPKEAPYGIQACYSYNYRQLSALTDGVAEFYLHDFVNDLTLSATEFAGEAKPTYEVYSFSDFGIKVRACLENKEQCLDSALVHGMAFITATYDRLTARIESEYTMEIVDKSVPGKYIIELGGNQTWVVYTGKNGTFALDESGKALVSSGLFSGTVRVAILPSSKATDVYDKYRTCHVRGGNVSVESRTEYSLNWETVGKSCQTHGMLHFALPHHLPALKGAITTKNPRAIVLNSATRGKMVAQVSTTGKWVLSEPEDDLEVDFYPTTKPSVSVVAKVGLLKTLQADIADDWSLNKTSWYFNGKQYQKYASLCLMAADSTVVGKNKKLLNTCLTKLENLLVPFLDNTLDPPLNYETSYGGLVSSQSFAVKDVNADFGNSVYNDHHYHYGYWVTASAMLKSLHPKWKRMKELDRMIWMMLRDVANPSTDDAFFPRFRHFSFYLGHSYSHGVTPMLDGKDEESTSEDVNFYYGMKLWGQVSNNKAVEDLGSLMLRLNARAIRTYFLMTSDNTIHPKEFVPNHVTGIFFDNKAAYATWFSAEKFLHLKRRIMTISIQEAYNTLGLEREATQDEVKKAYRKLALQFHPDKNPDPAATAKFQQLSAAYKRVDDHLQRGGSDSFQDFFGDFDEFEEEDLDFDDDLGMPSMEEMLFMFDMLFGPQPQATRRSGGRRKGKKGNGGVCVNVRRKGGKYPSYIDQEFMDMFAHGMMFDGPDSDLYVGFLLLICQ